MAQEKQQLETQAAQSNTELVPTTFRSNEVDAAPALKSIYGPCITAVTNEISLFAHINTGICLASHMLQLPHDSSCLCSSAYAREPVH